MTITLIVNLSLQGNDENEVSTTRMEKNYVHKNKFYLFQVIEILEILRYIINTNYKKKMQVQTIVLVPLRFLRNYNHRNIKFHDIYNLNN